MTDEEFEKEIDKMYEELDQKQAKMEELGLINYGDSGYYWRNPEEYEKDSKICELESKIERLEYLLRISDKALELACKELRDLTCRECNSCNRFEMCDDVLSTYPASYFIEEAKEKMKSE